MGAHTCTHAIKAKDQKEAIAKADQYRDEQRHENGNGPYTGHLGTAHGPIVLCQKEFATAREAADWILENHDDKWEPPMLAKCGPELWMLAGWCAS